MKVLIVGDVVGSSGVKRLESELSNILENQNIDFCIVNGENSANGKGIRMKEYEQILNAGADVITMGNHIYYRKEMAQIYKTLDRLVIPANVTNLDGNGYVIVNKNGIKMAVVNLIGNFAMGEMFEKNTTDAFECAKDTIEKIMQEGADYIFVDFHAEGTAEKIAMGIYLSDMVNCTFGTHTHVQTADESIIGKNKMAYITDVGMTGPKDSVIGLKKEVALKRFVDKKYAKYECSENDSIFNAIIVEYDDETKEALSIKRINN